MAKTTRDYLVTHIHLQQTWTIPLSRTTTAILPAAAMTAHAPSYANPSPARAERSQRRAGAASKLGHAARARAPSKRRRNKT
jgi:hypothetical protein